MGKKIVIAVVCAICVCAVVVGGYAFITASADKDDPEASKASFCGTWALHEIQSDDDDAQSPEAIQALKDEGRECVLVLREDMSSLLDLFGSVSNGAWEAGNGKRATLVIGENRQALSYDGKSLFMESDDDKLVFVKQAESGLEYVGGGEDGSAAES